jgi:hypothetical protein
MKLCQKCAEAIQPFVAIAMEGMKPIDDKVRTVVYIVNESECEFWAHIAYRTKVLELIQHEIKYRQTEIRLE